ncbi:TPA: hypothetical protein CPT87_04985 [Candidatus Gastranaerophilales bacterium HUM_5]|nr:MAG TPA: hypothetical protein CPT99_02025 [Candidatus Gastranaerophilales bacterium HUM_4]DAA90573.1 MAG TPA: hypothetical protein CPT87_04985 [Candidatus Gastranaerophilales bacterium HUM_5]
MSEIMDGGCRFERVRRNAYWNNAHLDTRFRVSKDFTDDAINHLIDCKENPTIGLLARKKHRTNNYPDCFERNLKDLYKFKHVKAADNAFKETFVSLYPKTGKARKFLIETNSIVLNYVKPIRKNLRRTLFKLFN